MFLKIWHFFIFVTGASALFFSTSGISDNVFSTEKTKHIYEENHSEKDYDKNVTVNFFNFGDNENQSDYRVRYFENSERLLQNKVNVLARLLKIHVDHIRDKTDQVELVFLVDASASVGLENFRSELNFVRKLLSDFTVEPNATRVAVVTFAGKKNIVRHIDQISKIEENNQKCQLLNKQLSNVSYTGGGTYTRGALLEALAILQNSREASEKVVFLITDGFSNSGDPRPAAKHLKNIGATIFTFGIRTGNIEELHDIASEPGYTHSYLLDSFPEFEALARRALHRDLKAGSYIPVAIPNDCNSLCSLKNSTEETEECCDELATCACGTATGHYACLCPRGYFGSGLKGSCQPCPNGTFDPGDRPIDSGTQCTPCANANHVTIKIPATSPDDCTCGPGFITDGVNCEAIRCPKLKVPENGYFVKASACSNVVNAACGLRCRIGFNLIGDSIRLCQNDGAWSGTEPQCLLKTCAALRAPLHGRIRCENDENEEQIKDSDLSAYPIDTRCQFKCDNGFQLRGSKVRNCLPLSRWDGLKVTCKQIKCEPLRRLANGKITPEICTGPKKLPFATNCTFSCEDGFTLVGPKSRHCSGKNGIWSQRHTVNQCIDKTPPIIKCPINSTWETLPGKDYAVVNWTIPIASDNSDKIPNVWSKPHVDLPWKAKIGIHRIVYVAQDSSGNRARCKFVVRVIDKEPPKVENCVDPPIFFKVKKKIDETVTWNEPVFHDNSGHPVNVEASHPTPECNCSIGRTQFFYEATDAFKNSAKCVINVTVEDACKNLPILTNGRANCETIQDEIVKCAMTCDNGFGFIDDHQNFLDHEETMLLTCGFNESAWNTTFFPECTATEIPNSIGREVDVILQGNTSVCDNSSLVNQLSDHISEDLNSKIIDICGNEIECNLIKYDRKCEEEEDEEIIFNSLARRKRNANGPEKKKLKIFRTARVSSKVSEKSKTKSPAKRKKGKIEIKFRFIGKIIAENRNNPKLGIKKLREKIEAMTKSGQLNLLNNRTHQEISKLALNLNTVFKEAREICETGRVLKKHNCTKCPTGTFHNTTRDQCQACYFGEYQNLSAAKKCIKCPMHTYTKKMHSKKISDCLPVCQPGYFSRRKTQQVSSAGLEPCTTCDIGFYQPEYGKTFCRECPENKTTIGRGSVSLEDCLRVLKTENPCHSTPCLNGGHCTSENSSFSCECPENFVGSICEKQENPCESTPCLNEGECSPLSASGSKFPYTCNCKTGYTGHNCQIYIDECSLKPCQNGGSCISTDKDFNCVCKNGFEGDFCQTIMNHCEPWTCEEGSTCVTIDATWKCLCKPGFLGLRCNLLPCDWIPCHPNAVCLNVEEINATRNSYRCVCPDGYEGEHCAMRINHCKNNSCVNGGNCVNGLLNYTCECPITFSGVNCETELSSDFVLNFSEIGTNDYVIMKGPKKNMTELTVCLWLKSVDTFNYGTVLSYATKYQDNALTLTDYNGFVLYVNGEKIVTDITVNDGYWHFLCIDWQSHDGSWNVYVDGIPKDNGTLLAKNSIIPASGTIVIGQEQDRLGGGFSASEAFLGKISYLDIWDKILGNKMVKRLTENCQDYHGTIIAWAQTRQNIRGNVQILEGTFCRGCSIPVVPLRGYININENSSEIVYSCETGYSVRVGNLIASTYRRKCLKHGGWEGYHLPVCTKVKCGYPGYFPRGRITGRSFMYGDEIYYECKEGYELRGNPHRVCNADGNWSGMQPICIGVTCKNLLAPENGDIEYIIEEHERDDISILQVGQQLEFKCDDGYQISGERYLTCLDNGKWDYTRPTCVPSGCPPPILIKHGYISSKQSTILPMYNKSSEASITSLSKDSSKENISSIYSFGDVVGISCNDGYKFNGNRNFLLEFRLQCLTNGTWSGLVPDCVRLGCSAPSPIENGRIFFFSENSTKTEVYYERKNKTSNTEESDTVGTEIDTFEKLSEQDDKSKEEEKEEDEYLVGTEIIIVCDKGYGNGRNISRICLENENWSAEDSKCSKRQCLVEDNHLLRLFSGKINESLSKNLNNTSDKTEEKNSIVRGSFANLSFLLEGSYYEDKFIIYCEDDTSMNLEDIGSNNSVKNLTWRCDEEGKWRTFDAEEIKFAKLLTEEKEICHRDTCNPPQIPSNAYIVNDNKITKEMKLRKINDSVKFRCEKGYVIEDNDEMVCLPNGIWSKLPVCKPVICKNPPKISNAVFDETSSKNEDYVFGRIISYKCTRGYRIFGQANTTCLANGKWSRIHGKCSKISCGKPKIPPGVTVSGRSYLYEEKLSYKCPDGATKGTITCKSDGKWSDPPICDSNL